jgi:hypothetical protein
MKPGGSGNATVKDPLGFIDAVDPVIGNTPSSFVNPNSGNPYDTDGHLTTDDVGLLWIEHRQDSTSTASIVTALESNAAAIFANTVPPGTIFSSNITSGPALAAIFGDPNSDDPIAAARAPDVFIQPNWGTIYSGSSAKIAERRTPLRASGCRTRRTPLRASAGRGAPQGPELRLQDSNLRPGG